jgi:hypothetical protein
MQGDRLLESAYSGQDIEAEPIEAFTSAQQTGSRVSASGQGHEICWNWRDEVRAQRKERFDLIIRSVAKLLGEGGG